ncbi:MAG: hypothetical protein HDR30_05465, partial [Lachnospiraceae bacterium]|nr:hypothetical protein [Lachnospiraceae bacterium]
WSGELSNSVAGVLNKWLPSLMNSLEVFYSSDDIEKGENWNTRLSEELSECNFGIVCLTKENVLAPWINFESGAISKTLGSKVSAFLIDIDPSDIKGPITRFQATRFEKKDFFKLVVSINKSMKNPVEEKVLENSFEAIWEKIYEEIQGKIQESDRPLEEEHEMINDEKREGAIQEILQIVRDLSNVRIEKIDIAIKNTYEKSVEIINKIEKAINLNKYTDNTIDASMIWIYMDAYKKIVSEISSLYHILEEEKNDIDKEKYRLVHIETINGLDQRLKDVSYVLGDDTIGNGKILLEKCKSYLGII